MTYKKIVAAMIESDARTWIENILEGTDYENALVFNTDPVKFEYNKEHDHFFWTVKFNISPRRGYMIYSVIAGGTVDDLCGICCSVLWAEDGREIIWMNQPDTRKALGIDCFRLTA